MEFGFSFLQLFLQTQFRFYCLVMKWENLKLALETLQADCALHSMQPTWRLHYPKCNFEGAEGWWVECGTQMQMQKLKMHLFPWTVTTLTFPRHMIVWEGRERSIASLDIFGFLWQISCSPRFYCGWSNGIHIGFCRSAMKSIRFCKLFIQRTFIWWFKLI